MPDSGPSEAPFIADTVRYREEILPPLHHSEAASGVVSHVAQPFAMQGPLRGVNPLGIASAWQLIQQLMPNLPMNEYALPVYIYRADMLDFSYILRKLGAVHSTTTTSFPPASGGAPAGMEVTTNSALQEIYGLLDAATVPLSYDEGYPVLPNGQPFWGRLEFESPEAYSAFTTYLNLGGARQLSSLVAYDIGTLNEYFYQYYWGFRVKAFDLYRVAHHQKLKLERMLSAENKHFEVAGRMLQKIEAYLESTVLDDDTMTPDKAILILEKLVKIQRVSVGLPANGESKETDGSKRQVAPLQVIMQQVSQNSGSTERPQDDISLLLENPDTVNLAQDLILKMQQKQ